MRGLRIIGGWLLVASVSVALWALLAGMCLMAGAALAKLIR